MNLKEWKNNKVTEYREMAKKAIREGNDIDFDILSESDIEEVKREIEIEDFQEVVHFEESIDLDEYFETDLNDDDCECEDEDDCACPENFYDFIPDEYGEMMDLEFELYNPDFEDDGVQQYMKIRDAIFADDFDYYEADLGEETLEEMDDPLEHGISAIGETGRAKVIFRRAKGQIVKRKRCPKGTKIKGNRCIPQSGTQKALNRRKGIKLKRAMRAMGSGAKKRAQLRGKITKKRVAGRARTYSNT